MWMSCCYAYLTHVILSKQDYDYVSNEGSHFHMVGPMHNSPNGFGASGSGELQPPPPMTPSETFMAT
jgi:hypothetical protein